MDSSNDFSKIRLKRKPKGLGQESKWSKKKGSALRYNEEILKAIEKWVADEFRSTNGQIDWMLLKSLKEAKGEPNMTTGEA